MLIPQDAMRRATKIEGFMSGEDLLWLAHYANNKDLVLEVGSWMGRSSVAMATLCKKLVCVDTFLGSPNDVTGEMAKDYNIYDLFLRNTYGFNIESYKMDIADAIPLLIQKYGQTFDMVFIDANHSYDNVMRDISIVKPLVKEGGIISGHDINQSQVAKAVIDSFGPVYDTSGDNIWYIKLTK